MVTPERFSETVDEANSVTIVVRGSIANCCRQPWITKALHPFQNLPSNSWVYSRNFHMNNKHYNWLHILVQLRHTAQRWSTRTNTAYSSGSRPWLQHRAHPGSPSVDCCCCCCLIFKTGQAPSTSSPFVTTKTSQLVHII